MTNQVSNSNKPTTTSRRAFLQRIGEIGGVGAVYQAMITMGLLVPGDASALVNRERWQQGAMRLASANKPTVAVIGGGIAGLVAAYELKKAGFPFFLIEARDRPGGRSHTVRTGSRVVETDSTQNCSFDSAEELYFNAGPARISHHHKNLLAYCRELNVALEPFINDNRAAYVHSDSAFGGQRQQAKAVIAAMRGTIAELLAKAISQGALNSDIGAGERAAVLAVLQDYGDLNINYRYAGSTRGGIAAGSGGLTPELPGTLLNWREIFSHPDLPFIANFVEGWNQAGTMLQPVGGMDRIAFALFRASGRVSVL